MIITLAGNNSVGLQQRLGELVGNFVKQNGELSVERLDGAEVTLQQVLDAVQTLPFLTESKLVVLRNLSANQPAAEAIEQIISSITTGVEAIFYEFSPDRRTTFYKFLKSKTAFEEFSNLDAQNLPAWLTARAGDQGGTLSGSDARYLIERLGVNQQLLASELDKLLTYEPQISRRSIDLLTEKTPQSKVFDLLDAAFAGNKQRALELYRQQRAQKVEPQEIMSMLAWQLRLIALAKLGSGRSAAVIAADAGMSTFPVGKAQNLAAKLSRSEVKRLVDEAEKIDRLSKSKPIDLDEAIQTYIATL